MSTARRSRVSVVIPTYNRGDRIERTIRSAWEQTHPPLEVIVVDDASSDETDAIVQALVRSADGVPIVYERHADNRGGGAARNTGVALAQGDVVAFLDSDDTWRSDKLERQIRVLNASAAPERSVVYSKIRLRKGGRTHTLPVGPKASDTAVADYLFLHDGLMQTSTLLLPRELACAAPIDPDLRRHQDFFLCMELDRLGAEFIYIDEPLVDWSVDPTTTRISTDPRVEPSLLWLERYGDRLSPEARRAFEAKVLAPLLGQSGRRLEALRILSATLYQGGIDVNEAGRLAARALVPPRIQNLVRRGIERLTRRTGERE